MIVRTGISRFSQISCHLIISQREAEANGGLVMWTDPVALSRCPFSMVAITEINLGQERQHSFMVFIFR